MRRELIAVAYDTESESGLASVGCRTKQLVVLATDVLLASIEDRLPEVAAEYLVQDRILPACYRRHYDERFLDIFHNALELTRNSLVSDLPFASSTVGELAAHAILAQARTVVSERGRDWVREARKIDDGLADQLTSGWRRLSDDVDELEATAIEDSDVLYLFDVPADQEPEEHLTGLYRADDQSLLRFENWLVPFGNAPRPEITYDGRVWPA